MIPVTSYKDELLEGVKDENVLFYLSASDLEIKPRFINNSSNVRKNPLWHNVWNQTLEHSENIRLGDFDKWWVKKQLNGEKSLK